MKTNLADQMLHLMSDGEWHSAEELVEKVSHRFSATMHTLRKKGYEFQKRPFQGRQYEYRLVIRCQASA
jgi:biotin operon repressor